MTGFIRQALASAASVAKVALKSRHPRKSRPADSAREIVILGNGPSLRDTMDNHWDSLMARSRMAVNFAAVADEFKKLCPDFYIMIDPLMFPPDGASGASRSSELWCRLREVDWPMTLFVPYSRLTDARRLLGENPSVTVSPVNITPVEGWRWLTRKLFRRGLGMPRPRNVLVAAVMAAIGEGFGRIILSGADHTWSHTLRVDNHNRICMVVEHFYADRCSEDLQVAEAYRGVKLHDVLESLSIAFRSYFQIRDYAHAVGVRIVNVTPSSMIDAFPRGSFPDPFSGEQKETVG